MNKKLHIGLVGGQIGEYHLQAYLELPDLFEVVAFCDIDPNKAAALTQKYNIPHAVTDLADLGRMDDVDVIDLCTPAHLHFQQCMQVLAANKHVICEKPVASSLKQIDQLRQAEAQSGKRVMPIFQYRFGHGLQKLKYLLENGLAKQAYLTTVETAWRRRESYYTESAWHGTWDRELGGPIVSHAIHAHDLLCYVLGPIKSVFARAKTLVNPTVLETEDCVSISLEMADGSLASLSVTIGSPAQISRHRFCFDGFSAESNTEPYRNTADPWIFTADSPELEAKIEEALRKFSPLPEGFAGQFYRFYHALREGAELPVTLADSRASAELITAIYHSAETKQVVELPLTADHPKYADWRPKMELGSRK